MDRASTEIENYFAALENEVSKIISVETPLTASWHRCCIELSPPAEPASFSLEFLRKIPISYLSTLWPFSIMAVLFV